MVIRPTSKNPPEYPHMTSSESLSSDPSSNTSPRYATKKEVETLDHAVDHIPMAVWIVALVGAAERFAYYAITTPWQNFLQNERRQIHDDGAAPGALGLGQSRATNIYNAFFFFSYLTPLPFAIISDIWLGRYTTLRLSLAFYICGGAVMFATSLPASLDHGGGVPGLVIAMVLIGLGVGGVKATMSPFLADQYPSHRPKLLTGKDGKKHVIGDRTLTIQYIFNVFYWFTNIAALSSLPSTFLERLVDFWAAFLLAVCALFAAALTLIIWGKHLVKTQPEGNILPQVSQSLVCAAKNGFRLEAATPAYQREHFQRQVPWDEKFTAEMKRAMVACRVILSFVLFYLCYNQISNNLVSQAGQMRLTIGPNGATLPNDAIQTLNAIACVILGPVIQKWLYPFLAKHRIPFGPIARITAAFLFMGAAMAYAAGIQSLIYSRGPCFRHPLTCPEAAKPATLTDGTPSVISPNDISVWTQTPLYFLLAVAEILGFVTASEYAYSKAPRNMKALVQALTQLTACLASAIGMGISPAARDPDLVVFYSVLAGTTAAIALPFWWVFRGLDTVDEEMNQLGEGEVVLGGEKLAGEGGVADGGGDEERGREERV